jgi:hypothetical protein
VVEDQGAYPAVYVSRRTLVCSAQVYIGVHRTVRIAVYDERGSDRVTEADRDVPPSNRAPVSCRVDTERTRELLISEQFSGPHDERTSLANRLVVDFGTDCGIDEALNGPGQWCEHRFASFDVDDSEFVAHISADPVAFIPFRDCTS